MLRRSTSGRHVRTHNIGDLVPLLQTPSSSISCGRRQEQFGEETKTCGSDCRHPRQRFSCPGSSSKILNLETVVVVVPRISSGLPLPVLVAQGHEVQPLDPTVGNNGKLRRRRSLDAWTSGPQLLSDKRHSELDSIFSFCVLRRQHVALGTVPVSMAKSKLTKLSWNRSIDPPPYQQGGVGYLEKLPPRWRTLDIMKPKTSQKQLTISENNSGFEAKDNSESIINQWIGSGLEKRLDIAEPVINQTSISNNHQSCRNHGIWLDHDHMIDAFHHRWSWSRSSWSCAVDSPSWCNSQHFKNVSTKQFAHHWIVNASCVWTAVIHVSKQDPL